MSCSDDAVLEGDRVQHRGEAYVARRRKGDGRLYWRRIMSEDAYAHTMREHHAAHNACVPIHEDLLYRARIFRAACTLAGKAFAECMSEAFAECMSDRAKTHSEYAVGALWQEYLKLECRKQKGRSD